MITDLLHGVYKSMAVLKKMVKQTAQSKSDQTSDVDNISIQLFLDVEAFGNQFAKFGVNKDEFEPYQSLHNSVLSGEKVFTVND
jgi:hypothetical protein